MRIVRQDVTGIVDSKGNASIPVVLSMTGEWRIVKVAASVSSPAEWSIALSGSTVNYGRGRRVTLGPELLQPQDTVTVSVTGGNPGDTILGSLSGIAGSEAEVISMFLAQPNTIALDTTIPRQKLFPDGVAIPSLANAPSFTVAAGGNASPRFTLPAGAVAVRLLVNASGLAFKYRLLVQGHQSVEQYWGDPNAPGSPLAVPTPTLPFTIPIERDWDSQLDFSLFNDGAFSINVFVSALFAPETPGQAGAAQSVTIISPAPWQAAQASPVEFEVSLAAGASATLVSPTAGLQRYLHTLSYFYLSIPANSNLRFHDASSGGNVLAPGVAAAHAWQAIDYHGAPLAASGTGIFAVNDGSAASDFAVGVLNYS